MKKLVALLLAGLMMLSIIPFASAEELPTVRIYSYYATSENNPKDFLESDSIYNQAYTEMWAKYGVKLEYDLVPQDQAAVTTQTRLATGFNADFCRLDSLDTATLISLAESGKILAIDEIIEKYCSDATKEFFATGDGAEIRRTYTLEDGHFYWLTHLTKGLYNGEPNGNIGRAILIRKDWLDKLGLEIPDTLQEFHDAIKAFQDNDVNGNGLKDEIVDLWDPLCCMYCGFPQLFGMGREILGYIGTDGKATSAWYELDKFVPYIEFMKQMVAEGLMASTTDYSARAAQNMVAAYPHWITTVRDDITVPEGENEAVYVPCYFSGIEGVDYLIGKQASIQLNSDAYTVMSDCQDVEAVAKMIDAWCSDDFAKLSCMGIEGIDYTVEADGSITKIVWNTDEKKAKYGEFTSVNYGRTMMTREGNYTDMAAGAQAMIDNAVANGKSDYYIEQITLRAKLACEAFDYPYTTDHDIECQLAVTTADEAEFIADTKTDLTTYAEETLTKLILGEYSLDDIDSYVQKLNEMGLQEYVNVMQARYDRKLSR